MDDLKTIVSNDLAPATLSTTKNPNYKDRLCGMVSSGDSKIYLGKEYTIKDIETLSPAKQEKMSCYQVKFGREVITTMGQSA